MQGRRKFLSISLSLILLALLLLPPMKPTTGYLTKVAILTRDSLMDAAMNLSQIYSERLHIRIISVINLDDELYPGISPISVKNLIRELYFHGFRKITILGDGELVPSNPSSRWDLYYTDVVPLNGDGKPDLIVGRIPASNLEEASIYLDKMRRYLDSAPPPKMLLVGARYYESYYPDGAQFLENAYWTYLSGYRTERLYYLGDITPTNPRLLLSELNRGDLWFVAYSGHGYPEYWYINSGFFPVDQPNFNSTHASLLHNYFPFLVFSDACKTAQFYIERDGQALDIHSIAEAFLFSRGGAIAYIGSATDSPVTSRHAMIFFEWLGRGSSDLGMVFTGFAYQDGGNWVLLGDPNLPIKKPQRNGSHNPNRVLFGAIYDIVTRRPIAGAHVRVKSIPKYPWNETFGSFEVTVATNSRGIFRIDVPPTLLEITVSRNGYFNRSTLFYAASTKYAIRSIALPMIPSNIGKYAAILIQQGGDEHSLENIKELLRENGYTPITFKPRYLELTCDLIGFPDLLVWIGPSSWDGDPRARDHYFTLQRLFGCLLSRTNLSIISSPSLADGQSLPIVSYIGLFAPVRATVSGDLMRSTYADPLSFRLPRVRTLRAVEVSLPTSIDTRHVIPTYITQGDGRGVIYHYTDDQVHVIYIGVPINSLHPWDLRILMSNALNLMRSPKDPRLPISEALKG